MIKGNNTLHLNQATMQAALQEWCDKHLVDKVVVKKVSKSSTSSGYNSVDHFDIDLDVPDGEK